MWRSLSIACSDGGVRVLVWVLHGWIARMPDHQISCVPQQIPLVLWVECVGTCTCIFALFMNLVRSCNTFELSLRLQPFSTLWVPANLPGLCWNYCFAACLVSMGGPLFCTAVFVLNAIHHHPVYSAKGWKYMKIQHDYLFYVLRFLIIRLTLTLITLCLF